jgi:ribA/ribD-fused uncharacterized protein
MKSNFKLDTLGYTHKSERTKHKMTKRTQPYIANKIPKMENQKYHFFWQKGSPFSQWHSSAYTLNGYTYSTAEQGMMHGKALLFGDKAIASQILATNDPRTIKALGRKVKPFNEKAWKRNREAIVYNNSMAKCSKNLHLRDALLNTSGLLVEASPSDTIWGIGLHEKAARNIPEEKWQGLNLLGKILTRVRDDIILEMEEGCMNKGDGEIDSNGEANKGEVN